ncbi:MAG TPA: Uma2 family endonuclease [Fimbriimonadaceae bacterium]|nr:Uma2 family endonuclease [Fimbriimonadaceae bacterium]
MSAVPSPFVSAESYLAAERRAEQKHEYVDGQIYAMAGASLAHTRICSNLVHQLRSRFGPQGCEVFSQDLRTGLRDASGYFYPDVIVLCGKPELADKNQDVLLNPTVLIEVLSESTEAWDRGGKFARYRRIESLREYILISQDQPRIDRFLRDGVEWRLSSMEDLQEELTLSTVGASMPLTEIYERVEFNPTNGPAPAPD